MPSPKLEESSTLLVSQIETNGNDELFKQSNQFNNKQILAKKVTQKGNSNSKIEKNPFFSDVANKKFVTSTQVTENSSDLVLIDSPSTNTSKSNRKRSRDLNSTTTSSTPNFKSFEFKKENKFAKSVSNVADAVLSDNEDSIIVLEVDDEFEADFSILKKHKHSDESLIRKSEPTLQAIKCVYCDKFIVNLQNNEDESSLLLLSTFMSSKILNISSPKSPSIISKSTSSSNYLLSIIINDFKLKLPTEIIVKLEKLNCKNAFILPNFECINRNDECKRNFEKNANKSLLKSDDETWEYYKCANCSNLICLSLIGTSSTKTEFNRHFLNKIFFLI